MGAKQPFPGGSRNRNDCGEFWTPLARRGLDGVHKNTVLTAAQRPVNGQFGLEAPIDRGGGERLCFEAASAKHQSTVLDIIKVFMND